jgi:hypothetical protein
MLVQSNKGVIYHGNVQARADAIYKTNAGDFGLGGSAGISGNNFYGGVRVSYAPKLTPKKIASKTRGK